MASLRSMIRDGRMVTAASGDKDRATFFRLAQSTQQHLMSHDTTLVNVTSVFEDVSDSRAGVEPGDSELSKIPVPKPPFRRMWLEMVQDSHHAGILVTSSDIVNRDYMETVLRDLPKWPSKEFERMQAEVPATIVYGVMWQDWQGSAELRGEFAYSLTGGGNYQCAAFWLFQEPGYEDPDIAEMPYLHSFRMLYTGAVLTLHSFARMNCHNVKLAEMAAGAPKPKGKAHPPFSIWHEIVVTSLPQLRREQKGEVALDGEKRELRFHKVRGHYADYTKGKGLFGRLKVRVWIVEHEAGDPELGTVMSSYRVE